MKRFLFPFVGFCMSLVLAACAGGASHDVRPTTPAMERFFGDVRAAYSGDSALETVALMEGTFRLPGNAGFDSSIYRVVDILKSSGYVDEAEAAPGAPLTYRIQRRTMNRPTWEPVTGTLEIVGSEDGSLLDLQTNLNMIAIYSYSTPPDGVEAELVYVGNGTPEQYDSIDVRGKIVLGETHVRRLFSEAVQNRGALGVLSFSMPPYSQPDVNQNSILFSSIRLDSVSQSWGLRLSYAALNRLKSSVDAGPTRVRVKLETRIYEAEELELIADVHGGALPDERFVLSAHVQEPGANDNASGVAVQAEIARVIGNLVREGKYQPARTISMLWGDEISSTYRYIADDPERAAGIRWGVSLDMVGEDTEKTGGVFRIEKMPDPSAIWTRGEEEHTEWWREGMRRPSVDDLTPHYLNDFFMGRCLDQAAVTDWVVGSNPYEGGSDHVPFLRANIPGLLLWHFTDMFYHTDGDRIDKVSPLTMTNVGVSTAVAAMTLTAADGEIARFMISELESATLKRLESEFELSSSAINAGEDREEQILIVQTWLDWYVAALDTAHDIEAGGASQETLDTIAAAKARVISAGEEYLAVLQ